MKEWLQAQLTQSARELLAAYGLECTECPAPEGEYEIAGAIGFTGDMKGSVIVASRESVLAKLAAADVDVADWAAEMANQLAGRLKNKLVRAGVRMSLATPVAVRGMRMKCTTTTPASFLMLRSASGDDVVVGLEVVVDKPITLKRDDAASLDEGTLELF